MTIRTVYLAGPIDQMTDSAGTHDLRRMISNELNAWGVSVIDPSRAWAVAGEPNGSVQRVNMAVIGQVDGVVAWLPSVVPTLGTPIELVESIRLGKPTLIVSDLDQSWTVAWMRDHGDHVWTSDLESAQTTVASWVEQW